METAKVQEWMRNNKKTSAIVLTEITHILHIEVLQAKLNVLKPRLSRMKKNGLTLLPYLTNCARFFVAR